MTLRAGFDVGGTNARLQLFGPQYRSLAEERERSREASAPRELADLMVEMLRRALKSADESFQDLESIGVGIAAQLDVDGRTVRNAPNLGWRDLDFVDSLQKALRSAGFVGPLPPIRLVNDLNAQVWGEHRSGAIQDADDVLAVYVGTGVGGAILANGELITGAGGNAGEIGHSKVVVGGKICGCGERGCVEAYAGGLHLEESLRRLARENPSDEVLQSIVTADLVLTGRADEAAGSHELINALWEEATDYLSMVIANAVTLLNPAALLLGGGILENCDAFHSLVLQKTLPLILQVARENLEVRRAEISDLSGMIGAADLAGS